MLFCGANLAYASVIINEVQLNPTEERFVELYNSGDTAVDLTDWYIQRKTATGTFTSMVTKTNFEGKTIGANQYFLISKSSMNDTDLVVDNLTITESNTIQIKNSNGDIVDKVGWGDTNDCVSPCVANPTSGKSIQKTSGGIWIIAAHTPRSVNIESGEVLEEDNTNTNTNDNTISSSSTSSTTDKKIPIILKVTTKIISPKTVVAKAPFLINSITTTNKGETYGIGNYLWNFGDGMVSKTKEPGPFEYTYEYSGDYAVTLSYFDSFLNDTALANDKVIIKVVPSEIYISSVGGVDDPYIEIENKSNYEINLSSWVITAGSHYFAIPTGTTILSTKKIKFSPKITGFVVGDLASINVANKNKVVVATYPIETEKVFKKITTVPASSYNNPAPINNLQNDSLIKDLKTINLNDLGASADKAGINIPNSTYPILGLSGIIGIGIASFLLIKRKGIEDYEEKGITAKDMKIVE
jgi:hypothetical protein